MNLGWPETNVLMGFEYQGWKKVLARGKNSEKLSWHSCRMDICLNKSRCIKYNKTSIIPLALSSVKEIAKIQK